MAEPQPTNIAEGDQTTPAVPASDAAEDRKAAAAMSAMDTRGAEEGAASAEGAKKNVDQKALGDAMARLEVADGGNKADAAKTVAGMGDEKKAAEAEKKKAVKVDAADVNLLVDQLDLSKLKATELLKAHDADAVKAMTAWVTAAV